jgi:hypothetical protein
MTRRTFCVTPISSHPIIVPIKPREVQLDSSKFQLDNDRTERAQGLRLNQINTKQKFMTERAFEVGPTLAVVTLVTW